MPVIYSDNIALARQFKNLIPHGFRLSLQANPLANVTEAANNEYIKSLLPHVVSNAFNNPESKELVEAVKGIFEDYLATDADKIDINYLISSICLLLQQRNAAGDYDKRSPMVRRHYLATRANDISSWDVMRKFYVSDKTLDQVFKCKPLEFGAALDIHLEARLWILENKRKSYADWKKENGFWRLFRSNSDRLSSREYPNVLATASVNLFCYSTMNALAHLYAKETTFYHSLRAISTLMTATTIDYRYPINVKSRRRFVPTKKAAAITSMNVISWMIRNQGEAIERPYTTMVSGKAYMTLDWNSSLTQSAVNERDYQIAFTQHCVTANLVLQLFVKGVNHVNKLTKEYYSLTKPITIC